MRGQDGVMPATARIPAAGAAGRAGAIERAAQDFESIFLAQLVRSMTEGLDGQGLLGPATPFGAMLLDEHAKLIARTGGIGVADAVRRELMRWQEIG